jgi:hypothetical protein
MSRRQLKPKYKTPEAPSASDMEQVVAYAVAENCRRAALIYPVSGRVASPRV